MTRPKVWVVALGAAVMAGCLHAPVLWSPDGRWLAYTVAVRPDAQVPAPGWIFETTRGGDRTLVPVEATRKPAAPTYRLWATRAETGSSVLLEESRGPLTSPCWSPDGHALAFGRLVHEEEGRARFEVVVQEAPDRKRVIFQRPCAEFSPKTMDLPGLALAWSPDGRYLAVPLAQQTLSLGILRADNGRLLKVVEDAYLPSWSPDGTRLAFVRGSDSESLHTIDTNFGPTRHLAELGQTSQAPVWLRDGQAVVAIRRIAGQGGEQPSADLIRVQVESGKIDILATLTADFGGRDKDWNGASFSFDKSGEDLFFTTDVEGQPAQITWFRPRTKETRTRDNPIDFSIRVGGLAVSPTGKYLALRAGPPGSTAPTGLWDLAAPPSERFHPLVPDDGARVEWITVLVNGARALLRTHLPAAVTADGRAVERATLLPIPGEFPPQLGEARNRLKRIGRIGRPLCERPADAPPASPAVQALIAEARLFFDYLREDYDGALKALDALEERLTAPDQRLRLLSARAQIFLGQGDRERAQQTIAFLEGLQPGVPRRIEFTGTGVTLTDEPDPKLAWPGYLALRAKKLGAAREEADAPDDPLGHRFAAPGVPGGLQFPQFPPREAPRAPVPDNRFPVILHDEPEAPRPPRRVPPLLPRFQRVPAPRPVPPPR